MVKLVLKLEVAISPISFGTKGFQAPKHKPLTGEIQQNEAYTKVQGALSALERFVIGEELILGKLISEIWHFYSGAFREIEWQAEEPHRSELMYALTHVTTAFADAMREAIKASLGTATFSLASSEEWQTQRRAGHQWVQLLLERIKTDRGQYSINATVQRQEKAAAEIIAKKNL